jgi:hypothetical protein
LAIFQAKRVGINFMLSVFVLVWIADICLHTLRAGLLV